MTTYNFPFYGNNVIQHAKCPICGARCNQAIFNAPDLVSPSTIYCFECDFKILQKHNETTWSILIDCKNAVDKALEFKAQLEEKEQQPTTETSLRFNTIRGVKTTIKDNQKDFNESTLRPNKKKLYYIEETDDVPF